MCSYLGSCWDPPPTFPPETFLCLQQGLFASEGSPLPLLHSSSKRIPANNCSYQKRKSQQALRLQDMNICTVNLAPRETLVQPGKRHLTCLPRKATPMPLQTNTYKNLPCTSTDQLLAKIKKWNFLVWNLWEMHWYEEDASFSWITQKLSLASKETGFPSLSWLQRQENRAAAYNQSVTSLFSLHARKQSFLFPQHSPSHTTFHFQQPLLFGKSQMFIYHSSSVLLTSRLVKSLNISDFSFNLGIHFVFFQTLRVSFQGWHTENHLGPGCTHTKPQRCCPLLRWGLPSCLYLEIQACGAGCSLCLCCQAASRGWSSLQWKEGKICLQSKFNSKLFKPNINRILEGGACITCTSYILNKFVWDTKNVWCWIPHMTKGVSVCTDHEDRHKDGI